MTGYNLLAILREEQTDNLKQVDCGTCPVTIACAVGVGGTGDVFDCCGATGVSIDEASVLVAIDCIRHGFPTVRHHPQCPLCSGEVIETECRKLQPTLWVPTVYAKIPPQERIRRWKTVLPAVEAVLAEEEKRKRR